MKTHCINCDGRQVPGSRRPGSGRIDSISRVNDELAWIVWKCPKCGLVWSTPLLGEESAGNAIAEQALANAGTDIIEADKSTALVKYEQSFVDKQVARSHECKHHLPASLCTICPTNFGVGRIGS